MATTLDLSAQLFVSSTRSVRARVGLLGCGTIGGAVADAIAAHPRLNLDCIGAFVRSASADRQQRHAGVPLTTNPADVIDHADVIVEALGGVEPARTLVADALRRGIPVVTANKSLMAAHGPELRELAERAGVPLLYEAAVLAGVYQPLVASLVTVTSRPGSAACNSRACR